jgi:hypothetical protein
MPRVLAEFDRIHIQESWAAETNAQPGWPERWRLVGTQRGLKVLGTFARLAAGGAVAYSHWTDNLVRQIGPELGALEAPSELVDLLLDLSRRRHPASGD